MADERYTLRQTGSVIQQLLDSIQSQAADISAKADRTYVDAALAGKVDIVSGKGLSANDYTTNDRQKLASIEANAQVNVPSDWNATVGVARILNKPDLSVYPTRTEMNQAIAGVTVDLSAYSTTAQMNSAIAASAATKVDKVTGKGLSTNDYTDAEKTKLSGIATGAQVNVQSDWNAASGDAFIKNKPNLAAYPTRTEVEQMIAQSGGGGIEYIPVDTLPTASAETMNKIYLVPISGSEARAQWITVQDGNTYSWVEIGTTDIDLSGVVKVGDTVESNVVINA